jgi:lipopolysaccharide/colanic/teichoic acid biosynthesis glycosyltransferase
MSAFRPHGFELLAYGNGGASFALSPMRQAGRRGGGMQPPDNIIKRVADLVLAAAGLLLMSIPMLLAAAAIRLTSKGPILFRQQRVGLRGRPFVMLKFRTMYYEPQRAGTCPQATRDDPRITVVGGWLRRTSFDELPQFLNVLGGSMSLVGPRPHAPGTCVAGRPFEAITRQYAARHHVKPGMTGLAQVRGWRGETDTEEKLLRRVDSDLEYIATWSLSRDLLIICRTVLTVLRMSNAY